LGLKSSRHETHSLLSLAVAPNLFENTYFVNADVDACLAPFIRFFERLNVPHRLKIFPIFDFGGSGSLDLEPYPESPEDAILGLAMLTGDSSWVGTAFLFMPLL
jgi:hypothetical protein